MRKLTSLLVLLCIMHSAAVNAQKQGQTQVDSMLHDLSSAKEDVNKADLLGELSFDYYAIDPERGLKLGEQGLALATKLKWRKGIARAYIGLAANNYALSNYAKAIDYNTQALKISEEEGDKKNTAKSLGIFGAIYREQKKDTLALTYYQKALAIAQETDDKQEEGVDVEQMGAIYFVQGAHDRALESMLKGLKLTEEAGDKRHAATANLNIGSVYQAENNYPSALEYYFKALKLNTELGNTINMANNNIKIGYLYYIMKNNKQGMVYLDNALSEAKEVNNKEFIAQAMLVAGDLYYAEKDYAKALDNFLGSHKMYDELGVKDNPATGNIGNVYFDLKDYAKAMQYYHETLLISEATNNASGIGLWAGAEGETYLNVSLLPPGSIKADSLIHAGKDANYRDALIFLNRGVTSSRAARDLSTVLYYTNVLSDAYAKGGRYKEALENYKLAISVKDTLFNIENNKKIATLEARRETELAQKKIEVQNLQIKASKNERRYYVAGLIAFLLLSGGLFGRYRTVNKNKQQLEEKNKVIAAEKENSDMLRIRAENSERFKQQFLANMSHEIRTPMNAVSGMTDLLIEKGPRPDQTEYLTAISKSSDILLHIINDILDLSKIEAGKLELESIDFSLADTIKQVRDTLSYKAEEKGLQLITNIDDNVADVVMGDPYRLNQILINLGGNAIKFTARGGVQIDVKQASATKGSTALRFSITDTGIGIPQDKLDSLFESFTQVNSSDTRKFGGTGLGLSISKQLVELQGGNISVESKEGSGTTFSFIISYKAGSEEKLEQRIAQEQRVDGSVLNGLRILVADDNEYNRLVVNETLRLKADVHIDLVTNGQEAIQQLTNNEYDVILMDVQMPVMNGIDATKYIRGQMPAPKNQTPIIALTASILRADLDMCAASGMNGYVPKPFKAWQMVHTIADATGRKHGAVHVTAKIKAPAPETGMVTDMAYLREFCEGDEERMKKYVSIYLKAIPGFDEKVKEAVQAGDMEELAALMHTFKPKWMMMGMKQTNALGQKIELLAKEQNSGPKVNEYISILLGENERSVAELAGIS